MKFSFNWLQSFFRKKLPGPEKLAKILTMHAFEVESVEKTKKDFILSVDVLPNRPDCYSHFGLAREISALLKIKLKIPNYQFTESKESAEKFVQIKVKEGCKRYVGMVFLEPEIKQSPDWIKERLEICGIQPKNNIVDIANYVMLEIGQPLHAFDLEKIEGREVIIRRAKKGEKILTFDEEEYELGKEVLVISDSTKPIAIAGIKGGKDSGISEKTKIVFLESANFEKEIIRESSRKIDLRTDASLRFEHGLDPTLAEIGAKAFASLVQKIAKAKVCKGAIDVYPQKILPKIIKLDPNQTNYLLGTKISAKKQIEILRSLQFDAKLKEGFIFVKVPTFRQDVEIPEDLVEEIGRVFGYQRIESALPKGTLALPEKNLKIFWEDFVKENLKSLSFCEVQNYSFLSKSTLENFGLFLSNLVEIENPVSLEYQYLRPTLICGLLKNLKQNLPNFKEIRIFELGKVFKKEKGKVLEKEILAGAISKNDFYELKGVLTTLFSKMGITDFWFDFYKPTPQETKARIWHLKRSAEIKIGEQEIGFLGEVSPILLQKLGLKEATVFEIDFEKLAKLASEEVEFEPISPYPAILRDISVLVPLNTLAEDVLNEIEAVGKEIIEDIDLIDIFEELEEGKKSFTFRIVFRSKEKALEKKEVEEVLEKIIKNLEQNPTWQVKK